jgi:hypothetical protein
VRIDAASHLDRGAPLPNQQLTPEEQKQVAELEKRDQEVRRHEQAHQAAAGSYALGGPSFRYQTGPNGKRYAVGGEVQIDTSKISGDSAATVRKMRTVQRAALAPADPSPQDRRMAAEASRRAAEAEGELRQEKGGRSSPPETGSLVDLVA